MDHRVVCRTCLADGGELFEVFGETGMELALPQKLIDHLKISVRNFVWTEYGHFSITPT